MQHSIILKLTDESKLLLETDRNAAVLKTLQEGAAPLELMLQAYHSREKVRKLRFEEESLHEVTRNEYRFNAVYVVEEYNVCSDIDRVEVQTMPLSVSLLSEGSGMEVKGIYLPEREPDSL